MANATLNLASLKSSVADSAFEAKVLHEAGLVSRERRGVWVYYRSSADALGALGGLLASTAP